MRTMTVTHPLSFFRTLFLWLMISVTACAKDALPETPVLEESDFSKLAQLMDKSGKVLLLEFHADYCGFCDRLESEYLEPMQKNEKDMSKAIIRKLNVGRSDTVIDFDGKKIPVSTFVDRYDGTFTPTLVFLDKTGQEVSVKIIGYNTPDLFGGYLDEGIEEGLAAIQSQSN